MADIEAYPTPRLLRWARETSRLPLSEVLQKIGVSAETLSAWESGAARPTVKQLRELGRVYRRPFALFFLPDVPTDFNAMHDFRRPIGADEELSPDLAFEIRSAHARREDALTIASTLHEDPPPFTLRSSRDDTIAENAGRIRAALGVTIAEQFAWDDNYEALRAWIEAVEALGVLVFQSDMIPPNEARGFSIGATNYPIITVNGSESPLGRVFTLMHELVHITLHEGGVCDLRESPRAGSYNRRTERFCNQVAAEVLAPTADLVKDDLVRTAAADGEWSEVGPKLVARTFRVSEEVMLRRLVEIGRASEELYHSKRPDFLAAYERNRRREKGGGPPPARMALRRVGRPFANMVLEAYSRDLLPASHLPDYFGMRLNHLPDLYSELRQRWDSSLDE